MSLMSTYGRTVTPEVFDQDNIITNSSSYIPTKYRIEQYLASGRALQDYREALHDAIGEYETAELAEAADDDPTRRPGFDPSHLPLIEHRAIERLRARAMERYAQSTADETELEPEGPPHLSFNASKTRRSKTAESPAAGANSDNPADDNPRSPK